MRPVRSVRRSGLVELAPFARELRVPLVLAFGALLALAPVSHARDDSPYTPAVLYVLHCQGCHGPDGEEIPGRVPALAGSMARFLSVPGGREFLARVPGVAQAPLSDADVARLLDWMLRRFDAAHVPEGHLPYRADEVARLRRAPLVHVAETRRELVAAMETDPP